MAAVEADDDVRGGEDGDDDVETEHPNVLVVAILRALPGPVAVSNVVDAVVVVDVPKKRLTLDYEVLNYDRKRWQSDHPRPCHRSRYAHPDVSVPTYPATLREQPRASASAFFILALTLSPIRISYDCSLYYLNYLLTGCY